MTGKLSGDEMLRRLDIITERRGLARKRRREAKKAAASDPPAGPRPGEDETPGVGPTAG